MTDYRLDGLSARTFEHLVQSLALKAITSTVTPFGDGPDGGREATFDGATHYGPEAAHWDGYGVIQAKFLQRPKSSSQDGNWIVKELGNELRKYSRGRRRARRPFDYYIIATNATLSAVENSGAKDRVIKLLEDFVKANGLKGYDIWDYDKIRILLDNNESVRKAYAAWITTGDVLMQISDWLTEHRADYHKLIVNYLQKELMSDQYAKLEQAGHTAEEAIPLAQVFVDLPIAERAYVTSERPSSLQRDELKNFVEFIAARAERPLASQVIEDDIDSTLQPAPGRFVLIGGPGQGKTTLGQYVCQMFRCSLLKDVPTTLLDLEARKVMQAFAARSTNEAPRIPRARRLPLRVVLSDFAAALAENRTSSLLTYLTEAFCKRTNSDLSPCEFEALIVDYPTVLVLDGLDEVPASSNRDQVLAAVQDFSVDIASSQMDALIIATSRPQGYNEDFSPDIYQHLWLAPLPPDKALEYGANLARVRFADDSDRIEKVVGRLRVASRAPATARIMRTPLQVTILTLLVDRRGQLPQERWALFDEYYTLIYQRETERDIPAAAILRERKEDIDAVHRLVGLLLQVESEISGSTDAKLTTDQFSKVVELYLSSEGNKGDALISLRDSIIEGAANRLVFLVGLESGQVGFEIRSLQEFMAAEGLLDAQDGLVQSRLRAVAGNANWRNVTVFAAGKVFAERRYLRDTVESICVDLNDDDSDRASRITLAGSELALDLLEDGPVARQPAKSRSLTRVALRLLQIPGIHFPRRLAGVYQESTKDIFIQELYRSFSGGDVESRKNSWLCLDALIQAGAMDSGDLAQRALVEYPPDAETVAVILSEDSSPLRGWREEFARSVLPATDPSEIRRFNVTLGRARYGTRRKRHSPHKATWVDAALETVLLRPGDDEFKSLRVLNGDGKRSVGEATIFGMLQSQQSSRVLRELKSMPTPRHPMWEVAQKIALFEELPSKERLADAIRIVENRLQSSKDYFLIPAIGSWPIRECLFAAIAHSNGTGLASAAEQGLLGDRKDWECWQNEWITTGISVTDLPVDVLRVANCNSIGPWFPSRTSSLNFSPARLTDSSLIETLLSFDYYEINSSLIVDFANSWRALRRRRSVPLAIDAKLSRLLLDVVRSGSWLVLDSFMVDGQWEPPINEEWANAMATGMRKGRWGAYHLSARLGEWLWRALERFPQFHDLLRGIVNFGGLEHIVPAVYPRIALLELGDNAEARLSRAIIGLQCGTPVDSVWDDVVMAFKAAECDVNEVFDVLKSDIFPAPQQVNNLLRAYDLSVDSCRRKARAVTSLRSALRGRRSELVDRDKWEELGFENSVREVTIANHRR